ncbi:MAG: acyltransferase family protein [Eubacterium sp.]
MKSKRNGKIELLRFVFCICVLLYHLNNDLWGGEKAITDGLSFFSHGRTGVEFFFLVSGYLAAKSASRYRTTENRLPIGSATYDFMLKKVKSVFTPHIILCALTVVLLILNGKMTWGKFLDKLPSLFFLQSTGISDNYFIAVEWYICAMLFALVIIYPMLLKNFDFTSKVIAPVGSSLMIGYMISKYDKLPSSLIPDPIISPNNLRGFAVILLGVFCYTLSEEIKKMNLNKAGRYILIATENVCWIISLYFMVSTVQKKYEGIIVYVLALAVAITFSRSFDNKFYNNPFVMYLGKISLTVYLSQNLVRNFVKFYFPSFSNIQYVISVTVLTVLFGIVIDFLCEKIQKIKLTKKC